MKQYRWWLENISKIPEKFASWLGDINNLSRVWVREFIKEEDITEVLDVACGPCIDYDGFKVNGIDIEYKGLDISDYLVDKAKQRGINVEKANIEQIPEEDNSWDLVYARHIIEHLQYYEKAVAEMCRVAKRYVLIVHFIPLSEEDEQRITKREDGQFYENIYGEKKFIKFCEKFGQVRRIDMRDLSQRQTITLIKLK